MAEPKQEKLGKEEDLSFGAIGPSPPQPRVPFESFSDSNRTKKKGDSNTTMSLTTADPNVHRLFFALDDQSVNKVGIGGDYALFNQSYDYTTKFSVSVFGYAFTIDHTTKILVAFELESGNTFELGFAGSQYCTGMTAWKNEPTYGDQLYLLLGGDVTGCFRVGPNTGTYTLINSNDYTNALFVIGDGANMIYYCDGATGIYSLDITTNTTTQVTSTDWSTCSAMCYDNGYIYATAQNGIWKISVPSYNPVRINYSNWNTVTAMVADGVGHLYFTTTSGTTHKWYTVTLADPTPVTPTWVTAGWGHTSSLLTFDTSDTDFTVSSTDVLTQLTTILGVSSSIVNLHLPTYFLTHKTAQLMWFFQSSSNRANWITDESTPGFDCCMRQINAQMNFSYAAGASVGYWHPRYAFGYLSGSLSGTPTTVNWFLTRDWPAANSTARNYYLFFFNPLTGIVTSATSTSWTFDEIWG